MLMFRSFEVALVYSLDMDYYLLLLIIFIFLPSILVYIFIKTGLIKIFVKKAEKDDNNRK